jgi:poly(beta-D-mannuronate) C5 epimerase
VVLRKNLVWKRNGAGIKFLNVRCGRAEGNILIDNVQKGIEVRKSNGVVVQDNLLAGNNSAGVWVSAQANGAQTTVQNNIFEGNAAGLSSATGAEIWIAGNNFEGQLPKLLDGDISLLTTALVRNLNGSAPLRFARGRYEQHDAVADLCGSDT